MGRTARGIKGISVSKGENVIGMEILYEGATILTVTENGYGKRTETSEYRKQGRGGMGIITIQTTERNGDVVGVLQVTDSDEVILITNRGKIIRMKVKGISVIGRNTKGVKIIDREGGEKLVAVARLAERDEE